MMTSTPAGQTTCTICNNPFFESRGGIHNVGRTCSLGCARQYQKEIEMFDFTVADLESMVMSSIRNDADRMRVSMSMLSDVQEMIELGMEKDTIRTTLNRVKYILDSGDSR